MTRSRAAHRRQHQDRNGPRLQPPADQPIFAGHHPVRMITSGRSTCSSTSAQWRPPPRAPGSRCSSRQSAIIADAGVVIDDDDTGRSTQGGIGQVCIRTVSTLIFLRYAAARQWSPMITAELSLRLIASLLLAAAPAWASDARARPADVDAGAATRRWPSRWTDAPNRCASWSTVPPGQPWSMHAWSGAMAWTMRKRQCRRPGCERERGPAAAHAQRRGNWEAGN